LLAGLIENQIHIPEPYFAYYLLACVFLYKGMVISVFFHYDGNIDPRIDFYYVGSYTHAFFSLFQSEGHNIFGENPVN
jgi:hypothetical protein